MNYDPYEVGWVAGIIDGEGSVLIIPTRYKRKYDGRRTKSARIMMGVCDFLILEKFTTILSKWGIEFGQSLQSYHGNYQSWHDKVLVQIWKQDSVIRLLDIIQPHLTLKQGVAGLVRRFAQWRLDNHPRVGQHGKVLNPEIFQEEETLWEEYQQVYRSKARSHDRPLSETIREVSTPLRWQD